MSRLSLADALKVISEPAPKEVEDSYDAFSMERPDRARDEEAARLDYLEVGTSDLRKRTGAELGAKYGGKKASRKELFEEAQDDESEEDDLEDDDEDLEDDDDEEGSEGSEGLEEDEEASSEDEEEAAPKPARKKAAPKATNGDVQDIAQRLKASASADVLKGRDVKKQLGFGDNLFEARIKFQKALVAVNTVPDFETAADEQVAAAREEVVELLDSLLEFRKNLLDSDFDTAVSLPGPSQRKRKRASGDSAEEVPLSALVADVQSLEKQFDPFLRSTLYKWSDKVLAASSSSLNGNKKFKSVAQNAVAQLDQALNSQVEMERLVKRTRVDRSAAGKATASTELDVDALGEERFDDGDFYAALLRDLIESRGMLDSLGGDPALEALLRNGARGKKVKKVVDTRASKGRKIRYHVHEKMQNFMIPVENTVWQDERIDELFASLLGRRPRALGESAEEGAARKNVTVGNLRLF